VRPIRDDRMGETRLAEQVAAQIVDAADHLLAQRS
jgi:hypothetical protein